jgi:hypothetical protein
MQKINMRVLIIIFLLLFYIQSNSQNYITKDREKYINAIIEDTTGQQLSTPFISLKIKLTKSDTTRVLVTESGALFQHLSEEYHWSGKRYIDEMKNYLFYDRVFLVENDDIFFKGNSISLDECNGLYNVSVNSLVDIFYTKTERYNDPTLRCLFYKLFLNNILVDRAEETYAIGIPKD